LNAIEILQQANANDWSSGRHNRILPAANRQQQQTRHHPCPRPRPDASHVASLPLKSEIEAIGNAGGSRLAFVCRLTFFP
jgi:hypothetical protein